MLTDRKDLSSRLRILRTGVSGPERVSVGLSVDTEIVVAFIAEKAGISRQDVIRTAIDFFILALESEHPNALGALDDR